jgi:hypothetical protein
MVSQDWLVTEEGKCEAWEELADDLELSTGQYRLYRFLTDLEDILYKFQSDSQRLQAICPLVRRLLTSSEWLQGEYLEPDPETGWSVLTLYDEPNFPLTDLILGYKPIRLLGVVFRVVVLKHGEFARIALQNLPVQRVLALVLLHLSLFVPTFPQV